MRRRLPPSRVPASSLPVLLTLFAACAGSRLDTGSSGGREVRYRELRDQATERRRMAVDVPAGGRLVLVGFDGTAVVRAQAGGVRGELVADLTVRSSSQDAARAVLAGVRFDLERDDEARTLRLVLPRGREPFESDSRYELRVPENVALEVVDGRGSIQATGPFRSARIATETGDVRVSEVSGDVALATVTGDVSVAGARGAVLTIDAGHGKVEVSRSTPDLLHIDHRSGGVRLWQVEARRVELANEHGPLELQGVRGELVARTGHGNVQATDLAGTATIETASGALSVRGTRGSLSASAPNGAITVEAADGSVAARSTFGDVQLQGRFAALRAETESGAVQASLAAGTAPTTPIQLTSKSGDVTVTVPAGFAFELDAQTRRGAIETSLPLVIEASRATEGEVLRGKVRGGGPTLVLRSGTGTLRVIDGPR